jgi:hypothetical protein
VKQQGTPRDTSVKARAVGAFGTTALTTPHAYSHIPDVDISAPVSF